jgi:hypothetical protein
MHEATRQLTLLGILVNSHLDQDRLHWGVLRGGYYLNVSKYVSPNLPLYRWNVGKYGNTSAFLKEGNGDSLDDCVRKAHQALAGYIREVSEVEAFVLGYADPAPPKSRYERDPVI